MVRSLGREAAPQITSRSAKGTFGVLLTSDRVGDWASEATRWLSASTRELTERAGSSKQSRLQEAGEHPGQSLSEPAGFGHDLRVSHDRHTQNARVGQHVKAHPDISWVNRRRDDGSYRVAAEEHGSAGPRRLVSKVCTNR